MADLKDLLLQHCNKTVIISITFVSGHDDNNYTVTPQREKFSNYYQDTFVPVNFINGSMINAIKREEQKGD